MVRACFGNRGSLDTWFAQTSQCIFAFADFSSRRKLNREYVSLIKYASMHFADSSFRLIGWFGQTSFFVTSLVVRALEFIVCVLRACGALWHSVYRVHCSHVTTSNSCAQGNCHCASMHSADFSSRGNVRGCCAPLCAHAFCRLLRPTISSN